MPEPTCQGRCKGTDRGITEAPVELVRIQSGGRPRTVVLCTCCAQALSGRRIKPGDVVGAIAPQLPPGLSREGLIEFDDPTCAYQYRLLPELLAEA